MAMINIEDKNVRLKTLHKQAVNFLETIQNHNKKIKNIDLTDIENKMYDILQSIILKMVE